MIRAQALYQSNIDCESTHTKAFEMSLFKQAVESVSIDRSQLLRLKLIGLEDVVALVSPQGTVQVTFSSFENLDAFMRILGQVAVTRNGEPLRLEPKGCFSLVDRIRSLIQEGRIGHETILSLEELAELTGSDKGNIRDDIPRLLAQKYPYGIELKVATLRAGCQRAEPHVELWLGDVERALRAEGFYSPDPFNWQSDQYFELMKLVQFGEDSTAMVRVRAFLNGMVITEATPKHLTDLASRSLHRIFDKYSIAYDMKMQTETGKTSRALLAIMSIALGALCLYGLSKIGDSKGQQGKEQACSCNTNSQP
jgi:hypothetical protein